MRKVVAGDGKAGVSEVGVKLANPLYKPKT